MILLKQVSSEKQSQREIGGDFRLDKQFSYVAGFWNHLQRFKKKKKINAALTCRYSDSLGFRWNGPRICVLKKLALVFWMLITGRISVLNWKYVPAQIILDTFIHITL